MIWCFSGDCCSRVVVMPQAPGSPRSHTAAKTRAGPCVVLGGEAGHEAERQIMGRQSALKKKKSCISLYHIL